MSCVLCSPFLLCGRACGRCCLPSSFFAVPFFLLLWVMPFPNCVPWGMGLAGRCWSPISSFLGMVLFFFFCLVVLGSALCCSCTLAVGLWVPCGTDQFGRAKKSESPQPQTLSGVVGSWVVFLLLLVPCVLWLGFVGLGVVIVFDICDGHTLLGGAAAFSSCSFAWCCPPILRLVLLSRPLEWRCFPPSSSVVLPSPPSCRVVLVSPSSSSETVLPFFLSCGWYCFLPCPMRAVLLRVVLLWCCFPSCVVLPSLRSSFWVV